MSDPETQLRVPPSLEVVEYAGKFKVLERLKRKEDVVSLLWREESEVQVVYIHAHGEPTLLGFRAIGQRMPESIQNYIH